MKNIYTIVVLFLAINNLFAQSDKNNLVDTISNNPVDEIVNTPFGPILKSNVHFVDRDHHLTINDSRIQVIRTKTKKISQEYETVLNENNTLDRKNVFSGLKFKSASDSALERGYIAYSQYAGSVPITYFSTNFIVPSNPTTKAGQLIYLFNGLYSPEKGTILQPVLQWGFNGIEGGDYWIISNWYVYGNQFFKDSMIRVDPGTNLHGVMEMTSRTNDTSFNYVSSFTGYPSSVLQVKNIPKLDNALEALEVYHLYQSTQYPPDSLIKMSDIKIQTDPPSNVYWSDRTNTFTNFGEHINFVNPSEIDICFSDYFHRCGCRSLLLSSDTLLFTPISGSPQTFSITSNTDWEVEFSVGWLTPHDNIVGSNNSIVTFSAMVNPTTSPRIGTITVRGKGIVPQRIKVIQDGATEPFLSVSTNRLYIAAPANSTQTFDVTSKTDWTVESYSDWLTVTNGTGSNNSTITLTATANPTSRIRTAYVGVSVFGQLIEMITVKQDGTISNNKTSDGSLSLFPNPVTNKLIIDDISANTTISIFNLEGVCLINIISKSSTEVIDVSSLINGVYIVKAIDVTTTKTKKLVKQ